MQVNELLQKFGSFLSSKFISNQIFLQGVKRYETVFLAEFQRHGARSHYEDNVPKAFFDGAKKGHLTRRGRIDQIRIGQARRQEYVEDKQFLSPDYNPKEILSISTFKQRCLDSGRHYLQGLYPLQSHKFDQEIDHHKLENSPLRGTMFEIMLDLISNKTEQCIPGPVIEIDHTVDLMMHTRNCRTLHKYLNEDQFDVELLENMMTDYFGDNVINATKDVLEEYFQKNITKLRQFFTLLDATVAEHYQTEHPQIRHFQRQECFILANNFVGPEEIHANVFVSRVLVPAFNLIENAKKLLDQGIPFDIKFLHVTFHDTNLSNLLRFLKYFETYGFDKFVRFSSSLRFELLRDIKHEQALKDHENDSEYRFRVVFDNEELKLPFCSDVLCRYDEFMAYLRKEMIFDYDTINKYCDGGMGNDYVNELKFK
eukprot:403335134